MNDPVDGRAYASRPMLTQRLVSTVNVAFPPGCLVLEPLPATVTQHTSEKHFGLPPRAFVRMARKNRFPARKEGRLWVATYGAVYDALTGGGEPPAQADAPEPSPNKAETMAERVAREIAQERARGPAEVRRGKRAARRGQAG